MSETGGTNVHGRPYGKPLLGWQCRETLPRALARALEWRFDGRAPPESASRALEPDTSVVVMPAGETYVLECSGRPGRVAPGSVVEVPPAPAGSPSRGLGELLGYEPHCGLACAFRAAQARSTYPRQDAEDLARGDAPAAEGRMIQLDPHDFVVSREELRRLTPMSLVDSIMRGVWGVEQRLCWAEIYALPEHGVEPGAASMVARGDVIRFLQRLNADARFASLDTAIVNGITPYDMRRECPGLSAVEPYSGILRQGPFTVLVREGFPSPTAILSSRLGPVLVHGPTVVHSADAGIAITHYCRVVSLPGKRPAGLVGGIKINL